MEFTYTSLPSKYAYFGYKNSNFHSYTGGYVLVAQFHAMEACMDHTIRTAQRSGFGKEVQKASNIGLYKSLGELRKTCAS